LPIVVIVGAWLTCVTLTSTGTAVAVVSEPSVALSVKAPMALRWR